MCELVHEGVLHVFLVEEVTLAKHDCAGVGREPARTGEVAGKARDVRGREVYAGELEVFEHELYRGA
jgi:hypothetical protein